MDFREGGRRGVSNHGGGQGVVGGRRGKDALGGGGVREREVQTHRSDTAPEVSPAGVLSVSSRPATRIYMGEQRHFSLRGLTSFLPLSILMQ